METKIISENKVGDEVTLEVTKQVSQEVVETFTVGEIKQKIADKQAQIDFIQSEIDALQQVLSDTHEERSELKQLDISN